MICIKTSDDIVKKRQVIISKIVQVRLEKELSQTQLAKLTGMHRSNICRIESGCQNISLDTLIRIFDALGKDV
ncbi:MAG: helix-turn-helix transcriptional regulator [Ruminococcus sp.]|uniref:helix-turn-helix domain-containing protein n=1 Tax=Ruminococcus sp. TaxID=41978 RepID=UPI002E803246|nr:helix-turn-helix transcriptional regulator [Ruminococcus sp.]MEE1170813.1 helix-turn-helix transcriptional regulator [Ruminococcus sp.]MEE3440038.1 helix-turn-helix transcriptional regulator [Ruminococcus sp.]